MSNVALKQITKRYTPEVTAVRNVSFEVKSGEFCVLVGPSGCGKSTTLRMVAGLEEITEGELSIGGRLVNDVAPRDRDIAMVFQSYALYPHMTVYENMAFGLRIRKMPSSEIDTRVQEAAKTLGISEYLQRKPKALSGGQRQRVAMGRAIVRNPQVFLFDEPLSNLDAQLRLQMRIEIARLHRRIGATTLYVTHDQVEAMTLADRIAVLKDGDLQQYDTPLDIYRKPANRFVATFIGSPSMNLLKGEMQNGHFVGEGFQVTLPSHISGDIAEIGIRPQAMQMTDDGPLIGQVDFVEALGSETFVHFMWGDTGIIAQVPPSVTVGAGDTVRFHVDPDAIHLFDSKGLAL
ncbi:MAG: sn-glycerol-3-phosphate ABC transporter ATP-binding protein UgpC [Myxococcota bacterium]|nr:sn-glycerol-3-phosphate ABC transporter ATP-binding protein UgpC [Myxococcota bacterium]